MLRLLGGTRGAGAPTGEERGGGISCHHAHNLFIILFLRRLLAFQVAVCQTESMYRELTYFGERMEGVDLKNISLYMEGNSDKFG